MRKYYGGYIEPEFPVIECDDKNGYTIKSTCYSAGCAYGSGWCTGESTCNDISNC